MQVAGLCLANLVEVGAVIDSVEFWELEAIEDHVGLDAEEDILLRLSDCES